MPATDARTLGRQVVAEALGTGLLVAVVVGSGIAAQRLSPDDTGLELLENAVATGAGLAVLILTLAPVSGAHFNPVVSLLARLRGGLSDRELGAYAGAQVGGACLGAMLANLMFAEPLVSVAQRERTNVHLFVSEIVATFGLLLVITGVARRGSAFEVATAVGGYITAAYFFTSSTSFANPAVTVGRTLSDTFAGIAPGSAALFVLAQLVGLAVALPIMRVLFPDEVPEVIDA